MRASSDDANYNTGDATAEAQRYIRLYLIDCSAAILATLHCLWKAIVLSILNISSVESYKTTGSAVSAQNGWLQVSAIY